ncbi:MAG: recombinase family protein [Paracoccaceae bacterium]
MSKSKIRCAIYTRKSTDEGLDQSFNSLDAQYEACTAYVASQRHEGWTPLKRRYDDGGLSGGTLDRPALQRLLADIATGQVDMIVVYKIDRLTRSLADFAKLVEHLDAAECSFVSVTQSFNTSTSMGRLTLNVLLSFAQFEREVTAERIRDKIAASKKKGLWMGGVPPLGYDPHPDPNVRELVVNAPEAVTVKELFELYVEHKSLVAVEREANRRGLRSKRHHFSTGRIQGGNPFSRGQIYALLRNPVYRGKIRHKDLVWPGLHPAIICQDLWEDVQARLQVASARRRGGDNAADKSGHTQTGSLLTGKFRDETGDRLTPTHTKRDGRRLRYYVSNRLISGGKDPSGWRLPAATFEAAVASVIAAHLQDCAHHHRIADVTDLAESQDAARAAANLARRIDKSGATIAPSMIRGGTIARARIRITLDREALADQLGVSAEALNADLIAIDSAFTCKRRGVELKIIAGDRIPAADTTLLQALQNAHRWTASLTAGQPITDIARREKHAESYIRTRAQLAFLSPKIQISIVEGTQPIALTLERFVRKTIPLDWRDQERLFGFDAMETTP